MEEVTAREDTAIGKLDDVMWLFFTRNAGAVVMMRTWMLDAKTDCYETPKGQNHSATGECFETFVGFCENNTTVQREFN